MNPRHLTAAVLVAILVVTLSVWVVCLGLYYHFGAASAHVDGWRTGQGHYQYDELAGWLANPKPPDTAWMGGAGVVLAVVSLLALLRTRFVWGPLHPIGYAIGGTDMMTWIRCPVLPGWLAKTLLLRYEGTGSIM